MKKNTTWVVRAFKAFKNAKNADDWVCDYCRKNGYSITDFNLVRREA